MAKTRRTTHGYSLAGYQHPRARGVAIPTGGGVDPLPAGSDALFDWDPGKDVLADAVAGYPLELGGDATIVTNRGLPALSCGGAGGLLTPTADYGSVPFASLDDVTGGRVTAYLVCERTSATTSGSESCFALDNTSSAGSQADCLGIYWVGVNDATVGILGDSADLGGQFDTAFATRNQVEVLAFDAGPSFLTQYVNGAGVATALADTPHVPQNMNRIAIGCGGIFNDDEEPWTTAIGLVGYVYRLVICEGAYNSDVHDYLAAAYTNRGAAPTVLFDFDPVASLTQDQAGGIALTDPVGGVVLSKGSTGVLGAEFDGTNYLLAASTPFAALSDLGSGGVSFYVVYENLVEPSTSYPGLVLLKDTASAVSRNVLGVRKYQNYPYAYSADGSAIYNDYEASRQTLGAVEVVSGHVTLTTREARVGGYGTAHFTTTSADPSSLDRLLIGAWENGTTNVSTPLNGRIYRVLICEGAFDQTIQDALANHYSPRRLPPGIDPADVAFVFDPRHGMYRDTLNGIDLTPASAPYRTVVGSNVGVAFDGTDDALTGPLTEQTLDGTQTWYLVCETPLVPSQYFLALEDSGNETVSSASMGTNGNATLGVFVSRREATTNVTHWSEPAVQLGTITVATGEFTPTTVEAWTDGVSTSGSTADTRAPAGINTVRLGDAFGTQFAEGTLYYALVVNSARDPAVETWLADQFKPLRLPHKSIVDPADILFAWDPAHNWLRGYEADLAALELTLTGATGELVDRSDTKAFKLDGGTYGLSTPLDSFDMDGTYTVYQVLEAVVDAKYTYSLSLSQTADTYAENFTCQLLTGGAYGAQTRQEELGLADSDFSGDTLNLGQLYVATSIKTPTEIEAFIDSVGNGATAATKVPRGIDKINIGFAPFGTGRERSYSFYVLIVRGARDERVEDFIRANWEIGAPSQRRPPEATLAAADIKVLWDPRHSLTEDTLNGLTFSALLTPTREGRAGDICGDFDSGDILYTALALGNAGTLDRTYTFYAVHEPDADAQFEGLISSCDISNYADENMGLIARGTNASWGATAVKESLAVGAGTDYAGVSVSGGTIYQHAAEITTTTIEAWTNGVSNGSSATAALPINQDQIRIGSYPGQGHCVGKIYFAMIVEGAYDSAITDWIAETFPVGVTP